MAPKYISGALLAWAAARGIEIIGKPPGYGKQKRDEFVAKHYHQPSDEVDPTWDLSGAVQDVQLLFEVGYQVANGDKFPDIVVSNKKGVFLFEQVRKAGN